jgi:predicted SprT family Zn-dependent metalloprotease
MRVFSETLNAFRQKQQIRLHKLYSEITCEELKPYKLVHRCPKLYIGRYKKNWLGSYHAKDKTIQLSEKLITSKQERIDQVLLHELAHHFQRCKYGDQGHSHGAGFKEMCGYLGIPARAVEQELESSNESLSPTREEKILRQVEKLFALGESPNEEEARSAIAKANELLQKYNLEFVGKDTDTIVQKTVYRGKTRASIISAISYLCKELFNVHPVWGRFGDPISLEFNGTEENVEVASYVFEFVEREVERFYKRARKEHGLSGRTAKINYIEGLLNEYVKNAKATNEKPESEMTVEEKEFKSSLVKSSKEEYRRVNKVVYENRLKSTYSSRRSDQNARNAGKGDSSRFSINKGVKSGGGQKMLA